MILPLLALYITGLSEPEEGGHILHRPVNPISARGQIMLTILLKYGFHNKSFILNALLVSCPIPGYALGGYSSKPKLEPGIGQLTRGAFRIKDL